MYYSVTKDEDKIYLKLVNADPLDKHVRLVLEGMDIKETANITTLTGPTQLVSIPNVNTKAEEKIVPVSKEEKVEKDGTIFTLPAESVTVVVFEKNK